MKNPPRSLLRAIRKATHANDHFNHDARHGGVPPDPYVYAPIVPPMESHGGVNKEDAQAGVPVRVPPYGSIAQDDIVTLYWNDEYIDYAEVTDPSATLALIVDPFYVAPDAVEASVHYHVRDVSGNERSSQTLAVPIKLTVPGNPPEPPDATDPSLNPGLALPYGVPDLITDASAVGDLAVTIEQYTHQSVGDVISLFWAGTVVPYGPLVTADLNRSITVTVPNSVIVDRPGTDLVVRYSIRDKVQNYSRYSPSVLTTVYARGSLPEPTVEGTQSGDLLIDDITDGQVEVRVNRYPDIAATDNIVVHWTGRPVQGPFQDYSTPALQLGTNRFLNFQVPKDVAEVLIDSQAYVYYTAIPAAGGATKSSSGSTFGVVGTRNELKAPEVPRASGGTLAPEAIGEASIEVTVLANPLLASGSTVTLIWSGIGANGTEYHEQQRPIDSSSAGGPITFQVSKVHATNLIGGTLDVSYTVTQADGTVYRSPALALTVVGAGALLPEPTFSPALKPGDVLDPADLIAGGITVKVTVGSPLYIGGKARLHWDGPSASIAPPLELPIAAVGELSFWVDKTRYVDPNLNGSVNVGYELIPTAGATGVSGSVLISVQDAASQTWPAPEIHDYSGAPVSSWSPVKPGTADANTANFVLRDARLRVGDIVMPFWRLPGNVDKTVSYITVSVAGEAQGSIPADVLATSLGKAVQVLYAVSQDGTVRPVSEVLTLQVQALPATALSQLTIQEAANAGAGPEFDVSSASAATLHVGVWPLIAEGQAVWLTLSGTKSDGTAYSKAIWAAGSSRVNATWIMDGYWPTNLPITELKQLKDGSALTVTFKAGLDGTQMEANAVTFAAKVYKVKAVADIRPVITSVRDSKGEVSAGGTTYDGRVTVSGTATAGQQVELIDVATSKGVVSVDAGGTWTASVTGLAVGSHSLTAQALYGSAPVSNAIGFSRLTLATTEYFESIPPDTDIGLEGYRAPTMTLYNCATTRYPEDHLVWQDMRGTHISARKEIGVCMIDLHAGATSITYNTAKNNYDAGVQYYAADGGLLKSGRVGAWGLVTETFSNDRPCTRLVVTVSIGFGLGMDNFRFVWSS
ncbi:hypothetical protein IFT98_18490 [Pseudomonas sp. CFBP 8770]|uniref:hypothetical protein n=1 Tax=unclassified Pseudomonas TaxID=196821 RepID=UPI00177E5E7A|nr:MULTISPECIES: hypothetical protein [unclassified Pseudomonas]MBD8476204.1 hypothetical protein [Pseudomonas sp. CFBP 8773]MBD8648986.1 hypothetical protein [Pseudomonas sp. CFBP 8770]